MSSVAVSEREFHLRRVPPASRLIPGLAFPQPGVPRKKPQSVARDRRYWVEEEPEPLPVPQSPSASAALLGAILPMPAASGDRCRFVTKVTQDFLLATLNLAAVISLLPGPGAGTTLVALTRLTAILTYGAVLTLFGHSEGLYRSDMPPAMESVVLGKVVAWTTLLAAGVLCSSGLLSVYALAASAPLAYFNLLAWRTWRRRRAPSSGAADRRNVLIVGAGKAGRTLAAQIGRNPSHAVCGFLDDEEPVTGDVLGRCDDLARIARAEFADEVILTSSPSETVQRVIREARRNRLDVKVAPEFFGLETHPVGLERYGNTPVLTIHEEPVPGVSLLTKRAADIAFSAFALALSAPLMAAIGLLIKLDSPGPVFYRASRIGKKGRKFLCYKFRTMRTDAEKLKEQLRERNEREGAFFKIADDPRITRVGRLLRRYSLDELPQLLNVLQGEMSLVGPRPHPVDDCARYRLQDLRRLDVVPGLTGLWQVTARSDPSFERNMALDLEYIERWNLWSDLKILCRTAWVVVQGNGA